jgi:hypothetical protein
VKLTLMLADSAQAVDNKLFILGGGWTLLGPVPGPTAIAILIEVPWDETNRQHVLKLELVDSDGQPVMVNTPQGAQPLQIAANFEVGRPPGIAPGSAITMPMAINLGPLPTKPATRYEWRCSIDGAGREEWTLTFATRPAG